MNVLLTSVLLAFAAVPQAGPGDVLAEGEQIATLSGSTMARLGLHGAALCSFVG